MKEYFSGGNSCAISNCLSSSRLKTIKRRGLYLAITVLRKCLPKDPVPPVTSTDLSLRSSQGCEKSRKAGMMGEMLAARPSSRVKGRRTIEARGLMNYSCENRATLANYNEGSVDQEKLAVSVIRHLTSGKIP